MGEILGAEISKENNKHKNKPLSLVDALSFYTKKDETWHADEVPNSIKIERNI